MTDAHKPQMTELAETIHRGHSASVMEADRTLRQLEILTSDAATSTRLTHHAAPSEPAQPTPLAGKQPA